MLDDGGEKVWVNQEVEGVLPILLTKLWTGRKEVKNEMKTAEDGLYELLDAKQKALKISMNSIYGIFGAGVGDLAFIELSRAVCAMGREMLDALETTIAKDHSNMQVVYGDSVSASTPIVVCEVDEEGGDGSDYRSLSIQEFWKMQEKTSILILDPRYHETKESYDLIKTRFQIYSDAGWTKVKRIIRHKPKSSRLYRIRTANGSQVEVTGDHSLLLKDGSCITPSKLKVGNVLLTKKYEGLKMDGQLEKNNFLGVPDFSQDNGEHEIHLFDLYHTQLMIYYLGPLFVELVLSGQTYRILYNNNQANDPFFDAIDPGTVTNIIRFNYDSDDWVYDLETENHHFSAGLGNLVVHNTDSVFVKLPTDDEDLAFKLSEALAKELTEKLFKFPIKLEFEKIYNPIVLFKKKNYVGLKKESADETEYKMEEKGLISVRKSTPSSVAHIYQEVIDTLLREKNPFSLFEMTKVYVEKMLSNKIPMEEFVQSARLKDDYVNPLSIPHSRVAMNVNSRAGTEIYKAGDRIRYIHYCPSNLCTFEIDALNVADRVEDPNFVLSREYKINYRPYLRQSQTAFLELAKFFPEVYKLEQALFQNVLNDERVNDNVVKIRGGGGGNKTIKKRKISSYFFPSTEKKK